MGDPESSPRLDEGPDRSHLARLKRLLERRRSGGGWSEAELLELPRLYRHACSLVARLQSTGEDPGLAGQARALVHRAHAVLYRQRGASLLSLSGRAVALFERECPRAIRAEWKLLALAFALVYGLAALAWAAVARDLDLAFSLLDRGVVEEEMRQLDALAAGEPFRGNFTFGFGQSPLTAGWIVLHNIGVGILFFASALVPPFYLYLVSSNGLMLGAYTGVAGHWHQAGAISSILWTHGVIEIQSLILVGTAGLVLVRAWVRPGPFSRRHALVRESRRAILLLAPVFPLLVVAGLIEGFVSPHASPVVRLAVSITSGILLVAWIALGGRRPSSA